MIECKFNEYCKDNEGYTAEELVTSFLIKQVRTTRSHTTELHTTPEFFYSLKLCLGRRAPEGFRYFDGPIQAVRIIGDNCE